MSGTRVLCGDGKRKLCADGKRKKVCGGSDPIPEGCCELVTFTLYFAGADHNVYFDLVGGFYVWDENGPATAATLVYSGGVYTVTISIHGKTYTATSNAAECPSDITIWTFSGETAAKVMYVAETCGYFDPCGFGFICACWDYLIFTVGATDYAAGLFECDHWVAGGEEFGDTFQAERDPESGKWNVFNSLGGWQQTDDNFYECPSDVPGWTQYAGATATLSSSCDPP